MGRYGMFWSIGFLVLAIGGLLMSAAILRGREFKRQEPAA